jgi:hypothetical protein
MQSRNDRSQSLVTLQSKLRDNPLLDNAESNKLIPERP